MHNQLILNTGETYTGIIFAPFSDAVPSDYTLSDSIVPTRHVRRSPIVTTDTGWQDRPDAGGTSLTKVIPLEDSSVLFLLALCYGLFKAFTQRKSIFLILLIAMLPNTVMANITSLTVSPANGIIAGQTISLTPTVVTAYEGAKAVCWELYYDAACEHEIAGTSFTRPSLSANTVTCTAPSTPGTYYIKTSWHTGNVCGDWLDSYVATPIFVYPADADITLTRDAQSGAQRFDITDAATKKAYGAMRFHRSMLEDEDISPYERFNYFISFPFDVKVEDIYGLGNVGSHWLVYYYDGKGRAQEGFFGDRTDNWVMIDDTDSVLHAGQGYLLQLNSVQMANDATWPNGADVMTLFFPALSTLSAITTTTETTPALSEAYRCTIDLSASMGSEGDRRTKDSYWRCIGTPGFSSPASVSALDYLYEWNTADNSLSVVSSSGFTFLPAHAYLVQHGGEITWTGVSKPSIAARRQERTAYEWRLDIRQGDVQQDRTYVRLSDDAVEAFEFGRDLIKELNAGKTNIYSFVGYERLAANCLPISDSATVVPVGIQVFTAGEYTFAIPEGTEGVGVTLVDTDANVRTNLGLTDYTVTLQPGTYDNRFMLEISPVQQTTTGWEPTSDSSLKGRENARKVLIDGVLYIVRDGKIYDARGVRIR